MNAISSLPMMCSTTELQQQHRKKPYKINVWFASLISGSATIGMKRHLKACAGGEIVGSLFPSRFTKAGGA